MTLYNGRVVCYCVKGRDQNVPEQILHDKILSQGVARPFDQSGFWMGIVYDREKELLRLAVDPLGVAWVYIARFKRGYMFCSDFGALVSHYPESVSPDKEAILAMLAID